MSVNPRWRVRQTGRRFIVGTGKECAMCLSWIPYPWLEFRTPGSGDCYEHVHLIMGGGMWHLSAMSVEWQHILELIVVVVGVAIFLVRADKRTAQEHQRILEELMEIKKADAAFHERVVIALNVFADRFRV